MIRGGKLWMAAAFLPLAMLAAGGCGRQAASGPGRDNVLRYALQTNPTQLDPAAVEDGDTIDLLMQIFEGLVQWNDRNEIVANIAEKWEMSPDGKVYTFHLRDDVRFHNGRKLTASDFVYSITRALLPSTKSGTSQTYLNDIAGADDVLNGKASTLAGIQALDDRTLRITLSHRAPYFLGKLTYPTAYAVCKEAIDANGGSFDDKTMVGTGPFKLSSYRSQYEVTLAANPDYHGGKPLLAGIRRPVLVDSTSRETTYESGGTDVTDVQLGDLDRIRQDPVLSKQVHEYARPAIWYLALNQQAFPPFKDKRVRQAFAHAIDKEQLIRVALKGTVQKANGILPPGVPGYDSSFQGLSYDPQKAQQLLAAAGYPGGKGFPKLTISYRQGYKQIDDTVMAILDDLKRNLGIDASAQRVEWTQFLTQRANGAMPCYHLRWMADYLDPQDFLSLMLHTGAKENTLGYSNRQFDSLCDQADVEASPEKRIALYRQAERIAVDDAPWVCIYFQHDLELQKPYVQGIRDCLMGHLPRTTVTVAR